MSESNSFIYINIEIDGNITHIVFIVDGSDQGPGEGERGTKEG